MTWTFSLIVWPLVLNEMASTEECDWPDAISDAEGHTMLPDLIVTLPPSNCVKGTPMEPSE